MKTPLPVLIAARDPSLALGLQRMRPDLKVLQLGSSAPGERFAEAPHCFVEWLLPDLSGIALVKRLREAASTRDAHITLVLELDDPEDQRRALRAGADDYMIGPLTIERLLERIDSNPGGTFPGLVQNRLTIGDLQVDLAAHQLRVKGKPVALRPNEYSLLVHFMENPNQLFTRRALIARLGKSEDVVDERTVDVWIGRLRRSLETQGAPCPLRTVRSLGYVFDAA